MWAMSCYVKHLQGLFAELGLDIDDKDSRKKVDLAVRKAVGMPDAHCPEVWAKVKEMGKDSPELSELVKRELSP